MSTGVAALISWLATALLGGILVALWVVRGLRRRSAAGHAANSRPPPYIPRSFVVAHVLLAVVGLAAWVGALLLLDALGWVALGALVGVALLGAGMFVRWLGSRRMRHAVRVASGAPAESLLPTVLVLGHGLLGLVTVLLVVLLVFLSHGRPTLNGR